MGVRMTASNDNRRVRKQRSQAKAPRSLAKMTQVLADIYARPPSPIVDLQDDTLAWLGDERHVPAVDHSERERSPVADAER